MIPTRDGPAVPPPLLGGDYRHINAECRWFRFPDGTRPWSVSIFGSGPRRAMWFNGRNSYCYQGPVVSTLVEAGYTVYVVDPWSHGISVPHRVETADSVKTADRNVFGRFEDDIRPTVQYVLDRVMHTSWTGTCLGFGFSTGALILRRCAHQWPGTFGRLVFVSPLWSFGTSWWSQSRLLKSLVSKLHSKFYVDIGQRIGQPNTYLAKEQASLEYQGVDARYVPPFVTPVFANWLHACLDMMEYFDRSRRRPLSVPTLVISGLRQTDDEVVDIADMVDRSVRGFSNLELYQLANSHHLLMTHSPSCTARVVGRLDEFLKWDDNNKKKAKPATTTTTS